MNYSNVGEKIDLEASDIGFVLSNGDEQATNEDEIVGYTQLEKRGEEITKRANYDIFVSHASYVSENEQNQGVQPLNGEFEFVKAIVNKLKSDKFKKKVFVDFVDNPLRDYLTTVRAYKNSLFGVFICSPRFNDRFQSKSLPICDEITHFKSMENNGEKCIIPIMLRITKVDLDTQSPFSSLNFRINGRYDKLVKNTDADLIVEEISAEIISYIRDSRRFE